MPPSCSSGGRRKTGVNAKPGKATRGNSTRWAVFFENGGVERGSCKSYLPNGELFHKHKVFNLNPSYPHKTKPPQE